MSLTSFLSGSFATAAYSSSSSVSYSCVVVPPPVPAAAAAFAAHVRGLLGVLEPLAFVTLTSRTPYFLTAAAAAAATTDDVNSAASDARTPAGGSATQEAVDLLHTLLNTTSTSLVLTVVGTMPAVAAAPSSPLTQAQLNAMVRDFYTRTHPSHPSTSSSGNRPVGFMVLRGDDGGTSMRVARQALASADRDGCAADSAFPVESLAYSTRAGSADERGNGAMGSVLARSGGHMVRGVRRSLGELAAGAGGGLASVTLLVAGYCQGHPLNRLWDAKAATGETCAAPLARSLAFLQSLEETSARTAIPHRGGTRDAPTLRDDVGKLITRTQAVRALRDTPSVMSSTTLEAEVREVVLRKILCRSEEEAVVGGDAVPRPSVVVTQAVTTVEEFEAYRSLVAQACAEHSPIAEGGEAVAVVVVPGVMAPGKGEDVTRTLLQLRLIPCEPLYRVLLHFEKRLESLLAQLEASAATAEAATDETLGEWLAEKESIEAEFQASMTSWTVALCRGLRDRLGCRHFNFSAFAYGSSENLRQVVEGLQKQSEDH